MEVSERRILPLPKRRVTSGQFSSSDVVDQQPLPSETLFNKLHSDNAQVVAISEAILKQNSSARSYDSQDSLDGQVVLNHRNNFENGIADAIEGSEFEEEEDEDDSCTGCRDWLENVKNKKKRKIPTSAVMGHTNAVSSPMSQLQHGIGLSPSRTTKSKTRRRRTWDVTSESRPDAAFRNGRNFATSAAVFGDSLGTRDNLFHGDFEFTCDSPVARNLPAPPPAPVELMPAQPISVATQTSPSLEAMEPILPPRHRRTKEERAYDRQRLVARQRREARAKLKPGEKESVWICNFCEYESIFGYPPLALIYAYTKRIKEEKREALKRQRLLAKARSKGKKKKKGQLPASGDAPVAPVDNKITPTHQNGGKTGIDKSIGPSSTSCTCCDHRRDKEDRDRRHRERRADYPSSAYPPNHYDPHAHQHESDADDMTRSSSRLSRHESDVVL